MGIEQDADLHADVLILQSVQRRIVQLIEATEAPVDRPARVSATVAAGAPGPGLDK